MSELGHYTGITGVCWTKPLKPWSNCNKPCISKPCNSKPCNSKPCKPWSNCVEFVTLPFPLNESFSLRTFPPIFQDLLDGVPFPRRDLHLLDLWSVEPTLYGFFHSVFKLIPSDVVRFLDGENFFCLVWFIPSVECFLGSQYLHVLTFLDRNLFLHLFLSLQGFR